MWYLSGIDQRGGAAGGVQGLRTGSLPIGSLERSRSTQPHRWQATGRAGIFVAPPPLWQSMGVVSNPVAQFERLDREEQQRPRLSEQQIQRVFDATRTDCRPLFIFIRETGCRREEAQSLQHWQVQQESRLVVFSKTPSPKSGARYP